MQCLPDFGGGGVANDEDVFTSPHIHAGVDDRTCAFGHHFGDINLAVFILVGGWFGDGHAGFFAKSFGLVHDVLDVLVDDIVIIPVRAFSAKREDHVTGIAQMFLNVCFFLSCS